jgi:uncharacterized alkaline shock family protein YloU
MQVFALIGPSGTGKSHRASYLAFKYNISMIIDDGLLILGSSVMAGKSAKREATRFGAIKRAIFQDEAHAAEVKNKITGSGVDKVLILGTSEKMVQRIAKRLDLPAPEKVIRIEEIASARAISKALEVRKTENRHVIPLPTFAIKKEFPGYLVNPLRSFWGKSHRQDMKKVVIERSIVRPIYNTLGSFYIAEQAVVQLTTHLASQIPGVSRIVKVEVTPTPDGVSLLIEANIYYGVKIPQVLQEIQREIKNNIEYLTGFNLLDIRVTARRLELPERQS